MHNRTFALAPCLLLLSVGASWAQPADGLSSPPGTPACAAPAPRFVRFELTDGVGAILVNPGMVAAVQASTEKPKDWSQIQWADGHTVLVKGAPEEVSGKLTRLPGNL